MVSWMCGDESDKVQYASLFSLGACFCRHPLFATRVRWRQSVHLSSEPIVNKDVFALSLYYLFFYFCKWIYIILFFPVMCSFLSSYVCMIWIKSNRVTIFFQLNCTFVCYIIPCLSNNAFSHRHVSLSVLKATEALSWPYLEVDRRSSHSHAEYFFLSLTLSVATVACMLSVNKRKWADLTFKNLLNRGLTRAECLQEILGNSFIHKTRIPQENFFFNFIPTVNLGGCFRWLVSSLISEFPSVMLAIDSLGSVEHLRNMLIEICTLHALANVSSKYWVRHLLKGRRGLCRIEWKLSDQLTEHGMSPLLSSDGVGGLASALLKVRPPKVTDNWLYEWKSTSKNSCLFVYHPFCVEMDDWNKRKFFILGTFCEDGVKQMFLCWIYSVERGQWKKKAGTSATSANWCRLPRRQSSFYRLLTHMLY